MTPSLSISLFSAGGDFSSRRRNLHHRIHQENRTQPFVSLLPSFLPFKTLISLPLSHFTFILQFRFWFKFLIFLSAESATASPTFLEDPHSLQRVISSTDSFHSISISWIFTVHSPDPSEWAILEMDGPDSLGQWALFLGVVSIEILGLL